MKDQSQQQMAVTTNKALVVANAEVLRVQAKFVDVGDIWLKPVTGPMPGSMRILTDKVVDVEWVEFDDDTNRPLTVSILMEGGSHASVPRDEMIHVVRQSIAFTTERNL